MPVARHAATTFPASLLCSPELIKGTIPSFVVARLVRDARGGHRCVSRIKKEGSPFLARAELH
jgi:hypothetical protein